MEAFDKMQADAHFFFSRPKTTLGKLKGTGTKYEAPVSGIIAF